MKIGIPVLVLGLVVFSNGVAQDTPKITKPVPVVPTTKDDEPKKEKSVEKVAEPLPVVTGEETSGVLPVAFVKNRIETMPVGTKAYVTVDAVKCDSNRRVFLDPDQLYGTKSEGRVVLVSKDNIGYHMVLEKLEHQWTCQELPPGVKWISIKTVTSK